MKELYELSERIIEMSKECDYDTFCSLSKIQEEINIQRKKLKEDETL